MSKIHVIGIGYRPLENKASEVLHRSEVILATERLFEVFKRYKEFRDVSDRLKVTGSIHETLDNIRANHGKSFLSVLADGDPLFFGLGRVLVKEFGSDALEVYPDLSSMQVAFSRIKEPWGDAFLMSLHGGPDPEKRRKLDHEISDLPGLLEVHEKIGILTDKVNNPVEIAGTLNLSTVARRFPLTMYVCEKLGYPDEKITRGSPKDMAALSFTYPNVVIILKKEEKND